MQTEAVHGWSMAQIKIHKLLESNQISSNLFVPTELVFPKIVKVGEIQ